MPYADFGNFVDGEEDCTHFMSCVIGQTSGTINIGGAKVPADITSSQYGSILNGGGYLNGCGLSSSTGVDVCVAVQNGRAVGVTVRTRPSSPGVAGCIASHVRGLSFPAHPKLDVTRTSFAAQCTGGRESLPRALSAVHFRRWLRSWSRLRAPCPSWPTRSTRASASFGVIDSVSFIGDRQRLVVSGVSGKPLTIDAPNTVQAKAGERIGLLISPDAVRLLPSEN
jgi:hypothetical protein